jgi:phosphatidylserine/phosphatidylglycerophosphate/cardiolipin synthase-like enzyme
MYELVDTTAQQDLAALAKKGVAVRVILDQNLEKSRNTAAYTFLNANGVKAVWANPTYAATHQKTITVDGKTSAIMTLNLVTQDYTTSRDFAVLDTNATDVAEIEAVFNKDFTSAAVSPTPATDLIWSPNEASAALLALIKSAKHSLQIENEEMAYTPVVTALEAAAKAGVQVQVTMTNYNNTYATQFTALTAAGVKVATYANNAPLYIHAKVILVDYGTTGAKVFLGSENFSTYSLTKNRELGLTLTTPAILTSLNATLTKDFQGGTAWPTR